MGKHRHIPGGTLGWMDLPKGEVPPERVRNERREKDLNPPFENDEFLRLMASRDISAKTTRHVYGSPYAFYKGGGGRMVYESEF